MHDATQPLDESLHYLWAICRDGDCVTGSDGEHRVQLFWATSRFRADWTPDAKAEMASCMELACLAGY
jgi:hypothetical protein